MSEYEAGRELDALVAEKVMGWERVTDPEEIARREGVDSEDRADGERWHRKEVWFDGDLRKACLECGTLPAYSTDIAAAWEVVEKLGADRTISVVKCCDGYACTITPHEPPMHLGDGQAGAETAPLAICRAALAALGDRP